ncbi:MarR family transcriptional regulator [Clostridium sp. SHJSY1]|uniref:MarR family winged helix-turn-helix transcriptional regulator n=1 Tax=Clostridium sp. SHJSY1 TaxID=2942483 RepID=UPI002874601C|nr:MarR family transcriptional regulator [Clostridium sp. SHJSY1]MDS0526117.1 MarR family transcriptional regulator [Clostridium sp. SHJSY1]
MDSKSTKEIEELSELFHGIVKKYKYRKLEEEFSRISTITTTEIGIINIVSKNPDVILGEICAELDIPKSTLTNAINRLEKREYINRIISKRDKRSYGLQLTEEGHLVQKEHIEFEKKIYGSMLDALDTNEEREEFFKLLRKIAKYLE